MSFTWARGRTAFPALFLLLFIGIGLSAFAQGNEWRVLLMGDISQDEANAKTADFSGIGETVVLPYNGKYGIFFGSFATQEEAQKKRDDLGAEGWMVQQAVQPGVSPAEAPPPPTPAPAALDMATPVSGAPQGTPDFSGAASQPLTTLSNAGATTSATTYRVEAGSFPDEASAQAKKADLENNQGVFPVEVGLANGRYHVYIGYPGSAADAERDAANFRRDLPNLTITVAEVAGAPGIDAATFSTIQGGATQQEIDYLRDLQSKAEGGRTGRVGQDEADRAMEALRNLDAKQQEILQQFTKQREREANAIRYNQEIRRAATDGDMAKADSLLAEWRQSDPTSPSVGLMQEWVDVRKKGSSAPGSNASAVQDLVEKAEKAEAAGERQAALDLWQQARRAAVDDATARRAADRITILTGELSKTVVAPQTGAQLGGVNSSLLLYVGIGAGVLIIVGIIIFFLMKKKNAGAPQPALSPARAGMMTTPLPLSGNSMLSAMQGVKRDSKSAPRFTSQSGVQRLPARDKPTNPRPSGEISKPAAAELARYEAMATPPPTSQSVNLPAAASSPHAPIPAPAAESTSGVNGAQPGMEPILNSSVNLGNLVLPDAFPSEGEVLPAEPLEEAPAREPAPPALEEDDIGSVQTVRMSDVGSPKPEVAPVKAAAPPAAPAPIRTAPVPATAGISAATPAPVPTVANTYFEQKFDDEEVGSMPKGWKGSYDYATLSIAEREGGGKCMKFEKGKGTGSAYFSCRFPDAAGRVVVEFDLRCDHKNKYLLGFYVEMDEDFRHSVHTVVHMDATKADKVSLRLQNETAPYKLGEWSRMRYLIDLPRNMVDGFVDDKPVAVGVRLPSRPRVVNTLSIRDNLATEGILMIDNIRIYKDRG